jgi:hypothetical protein
MNAGNMNAGNMKDSRLRVFLLLHSLQRLEELRQFTHPRAIPLTS